VALRTDRRSRSLRATLAITEGLIVATVLALFKLAGLPGHPLGHELLEFGNPHRRHATPPPLDLRGNCLLLGRKGRRHFTNGKERNNAHLLLERITGYQFF
jgi:hypothetical protein